MGDIVIIFNKEAATPYKEGADTYEFRVLNHILETRKLSLVPLGDESEDINAIFHVHAAPDARAGSAEKFLLQVSEALEMQIGPLAKIIDGAYRSPPPALPGGM